MRSCLFLAPKITTSCPHCVSPQPVQTIISPARTPFILWNPDVFLWGKNNWINGRERYETAHTTTTTTRTEKHTVSVSLPLRPKIIIDCSLFLRGSNSLVTPRGHSVRYTTRLKCWMEQQSEIELLRMTEQWKRDVNFQWLPDWRKVCLQ